MDYQILIWLIATGIAQGWLFDFNIYYGVFKEAQLRAKKYWYFVWKFWWDFPITIIVSLYIFHIDLQYIEMFYLMKWVGFTDLFYILAWMIVKRKPYNPEGEMYWFWFTPLGLWRTFQIQRETYGEKYERKIDDPVNWWKGHISMKEYYFQLVIGIVLSYPIALLLNLLIHKFINLFI